MALVAASTNIGTKKQVNQDACCIKVAKTSVGEVILAVICDGVGGLSLGELASTTVVNSFIKWFDESCLSYLKNNTKNCYADLSNLQRIWTQLINNANSAIYSYGCEQQSNLGTTCSALLVCQNSYIIAHVGDCRIYRISKDSHSLLTKDQTLIQQKLDNNAITEQEATNHPQKNILLQAIGTKKQIKPEFYMGNCLPEDAFVLCCDGLYRSLDETFMANSFREVLQTNNNAIRSVCDKLVNSSLANGSQDNITVVFVQLSKLDKQWPSQAMRNFDGEQGTSVIGTVHDEGDDQATSVFDDNNDQGTTILDTGDDQGTPILEASQESCDEPTSILSDDEQTTALDLDEGAQNG